MNPFTEICQVSMSPVMKFPSNEAQERTELRKNRSTQIANVDSSLAKDSNLLINGISHLMKNKPY